MFRETYRLLRRNVLHSLMPGSQMPVFPDGKEGIEVVGFFRSPTGLGELARLCAHELRKNGRKVRCRSIERLFLQPKPLGWAFPNSAEPQEIGCRIIHVNPPMLPPIVIGLGLRAYASVFNIGCWAWELERLPREWVSATRYVNAILTPSSFTSNAVRKETSKPVITVPHPVRCPEFTPDIRLRIGIPETAFLISTIFNFSSNAERKNPWTAIEAFINAFGRDPHTQLILKCSDGASAPQEKNTLLSRIAGHGNIQLIDAVWDREDVSGLIKASDLYVSCHRSEGFGLTIAEAMLLGVPTMVTGWSGNMDFCSPANCFLISAKQVPVVLNTPEFREMEDTSWADADASHAEQLLIYIYKNRSEARKKAERAKLELTHYLSKPHYISALDEISCDVAQLQR